MDLQVLGKLPLQKLLQVLSQIYSLIQKGFRMSIIREARYNFHIRLKKEIIRKRREKKHGECHNFSDADSKKSVILGNGIANKIPGSLGSTNINGQKAGALFERAVMDFLKDTFTKLDTIRPGNWVFSQKRSDVAEEKRIGVTGYEQYTHLSELEKLSKKFSEIADIAGYDYIVKPDVIIGRLPEPDETINAKNILVDENISLQTPIRKINNELPILHASISCKWTMRSDRSQNSRTEALNLIRNRKGALPHIVVVTMEPLPSRIASIAIGTGDIDCVYHAALYELLETASDAYQEGILDKDDHEWIFAMVKAKRLRDISDLPLDLAI
jgi:hypothetical protein